ncbi:hypothetical protein ACET3Z_029852 [Daucus carota]
MLAFVHEFFLNTLAYLSNRFPAGTPPDTAAAIPPPVPSEIEEIGAEVVPADGSAVTEIEEIVEIEIPATQANDVVAVPPPHDNVLAF